MKTILYECWVDYEKSPFFLRDSRASETRARVKIKPHEQGETQRRERKIKAQAFHPSIEGIPLDGLNWFERRYELHTPKSVGRERSKAWTLSVVPHFSLSLSAVSRLSRVGWFSPALAFRSLYYPWGKMGTTRSLNAVRNLTKLWRDCFM